MRRHAVFRAAALAALLPLLVQAWPAAAQQQPAAGSPVPLASPDFTGTPGRQTAAIPPEITVRDPADPPPIAVPGTLGQVRADFEVHGDLVLASGQLAGFRDACGFGLHPDPEELFDWYRHYQLARSEVRIRGIFALGEELGRDGTCTAARQDALVAEWERLLERTRRYVALYRQEDGR